MKLQHVIKLNRTLIIGLFTLALIACGGNKKDEFFPEEKAAKKPKVSNQVKLVRHWKANLGSDIESGAIILSPAFHGQSIYAAASNGRVYKLNAKSGKRVWQSKFKKTVISGGVGVGSALVLFGTDKGELYGINQTDGSVAWKQQLSSEILASPVVDRDIVVARTIDGKVYGVSALDGKIMWTISRQLPRLTLRGESSPLMYEGVVFVGFSDGNMAAIELTSGRALWDFPISFPRGTSEIDRLSDIDATPLLVGSYIYATSYQEVTHALNIEKQRIEWSTDVSSFNAIAYDAAYLYISDRNGIVHQIDRTNGNKTWSQDGLELRSLSAPISLGSFILVAEGDGGLFAISKKTGKFVGRFKLGAKNIVGTPIIEGDRAYFIDTDGDLQSISLASKSK